MELAELGITGQGIALLCITNKDSRDFVAQGLKGMGLKVTEAQSIDDALEKMRFNQYALLIMEDKFGEGLQNNKVLETIRQMAPSQRRRIFVVLLGGQWKTGDEMTAFSLSVNFLINESSLGQLKDTLTHALIEHKRFYKLYKEGLVSIGKA